jgi:AMP-binding enzyme C-terminal domain
MIFGERMGAEGIRARPFVSQDGSKWQSRAVLFQQVNALNQLVASSPPGRIRIEPGDVEAVFRTHPAVDDTLVTTLEDQLVGYLVVPEPTEPAVADAVRAFAADRLPPAIVPTRLVLLPEVLRNANGKVDHRRPPPPDRRSSADPGCPGRSLRGISPVFRRS